MEDIAEDKIVKIFHALSVPSVFFFSVTSPTTNATRLLKYCGGLRVKNVSPSESLLIPPRPRRKLTFINLHPVNFRSQLLGRLISLKTPAFAYKAMPSSLFDSQDFNEG